ncbi:helix-turn-helix domain-containing protein [Rhodococcus qingshengii]
MTTSLELVDSNGDETVKDAVARRLRQELAGKPRRISQRRIAEVVDMTQQQLSTRLTGKVEFGVEELTKVCEATNIDLVYVVTGQRRSPRHPGGDDGGARLRGLDQRPPHG